MITCMVNMTQMQALYKFCKSVKELYIYNFSVDAKMLAKALFECNLKIAGFVDCNPDSCAKNQNIYCINSFQKSKSFFDFDKRGIIITENERQICVDLKKHGFQKIFILNNQLLKDIVKKISPRYDFINLEVNLADHCNLNCQCCDHYSPIAPKNFLSLSQFENDIARLFHLFGNKKEIQFQLQLVGGEPTLHPQLIDFFRIARKYFPYCHIGLVTNAILLLKLEHGEHGNVWQAMKDYNIFLMITTYPINLDFSKLDEKAKEYGLKYIRFTDIGTSKLGLRKISTNHTFDKKEKIEPYEFLSCYQFNESQVLRKGKVYLCPISAYVDFYNNYFQKDLKITADDYLDIYKINDYKELVDFVSSKAPFCANCSVKKRFSREFAISKKELSEWTYVRNCYGKSRCVYR